MSAALTVAIWLGACFFWFRAGAYFARCEAVEIARAMKGDRIADIISKGRRKGSK